MQRTLSWVALCAALGACKGELTVDDSGEHSAPPESAPDDSAPGDSTDSTDSTDSQPAELHTLGFAVEGAWEGTGVELVWLSDFEAEDPFGATLASSPAPSATPSLEVPTPPTEHLIEAEDFPGLYVAYYVPGLFDDSDGDGVRDAAEPFVGVSAVWLLWLDGVVPEPLLMAGLKPGWNAVALFAEEGEPFVYDTAALPLPSSLWPVEAVSVSGTTHADLQALGALGLMAIPVVALDGGASAGLYADTPITDAWTLEFSGEPPAADELDPGDWYVQGAAYLPLVYLDSDGSGSWSGDEGTVSPICAEDAVVVVQYAYPPTRMLYAWGMSAQGWHAGWSAVAIRDDGNAPALLAEGAELVAGSGCSLE